MKELLKAKSEFRKKGVVLMADKKKTGAGGTWFFAGEDNLIKTIQKPLAECGLELISLMEKNSVTVTLFHVDSAESISSTIDLTPVAPRLNSSGNPMYLDAEIERGKQFGYWSRILSIRLLGLSDIDAEDINNMPEDISDETVKLKNELKELIAKTPDAGKTKEWICKTYKVQSINALPSNNLSQIIKLISAKQNNENTAA